MAARMTHKIGKITRGGHHAHTRMGLPRGNPLAGGGNFAKGSGGRPRRGRSTGVARGRRGY